MKIALLRLVKGCRVCGCARPRGDGLWHWNVSTEVLRLTVTPQEPSESRTLPQEETAESVRFPSFLVGTPRRRNRKCASEIGKISKTGSAERLGYEYFKSATIRMLAYEPDS
jgi:hypothetical protein